MNFFSACFRKTKESQALIEWRVEDQPLRFSLNLSEFISLASTLLAGLYSFVFITRWKVYFLHSRCVPHRHRLSIWAPLARSHALSACGRSAPPEMLTLDSSTNSERRGNNKWARRRGRKMWPKRREKRKLPYRRCERRTRGATETKKKMSVIYVNASSCSEH